MLLPNYLRSFGTLRQARITVLVLSIVFVFLVWASIAEWHPIARWMAASVAVMLPGVVLESVGSSVHGKVQFVGGALLVAICAIGAWVTRDLTLLALAFAMAGFLVFWVRRCKQSDAGMIDAS